MKEMRKEEERTSLRNGERRVEVESHLLDPARDVEPTRATNKYFPSIRDVRKSKKESEGRR